MMWPVLYYVLYVMCIMYTLASPGGLSSTQYNATSVRYTQKQGTHFMEGKLKKIGQQFV